MRSALPAKLRPACHRCRPAQRARSELPSARRRRRAIRSQDRERRRSAEDPGPAEQGAEVPGRGRHRARLAARVPTRSGNAIVPVEAPRRRGLFRAPAHLGGGRLPGQRPAAWSRAAGLAGPRAGPRRTTPSPASRTPPPIAPCIGTCATHAWRAAHLDLLSEPRARIVEPLLGRLGKRSTGMRCPPA